MIVTLNGKTTGERVRVARTCAGLSRAQLADELCVSYTMVYKYENGMAKVPARKLKKISEVCGVPVEELVERI